LRGPVDALEGEVEIHLGSNELQSKLHGRFDDGELVLTESSENPSTYRARLRPSGVVLEGEFLRRDQAPVPFALVRIE